MRKKTEKIAVVKFGGTSIETLGYEGVVNKILSDFPTHKVICVLSASRGVTKNLINDYTHSIQEASKREDIESGELFSSALREYDLLISQGEIRSIIEISIVAKSKKIKSIALTGQQAGVQSNSNFSSAIIEQVSAENLNEALKSNDMVFVAGFQGACPGGHITTLGRGASDLTAIALATAINSSDVFIYTDVPAIYTSDPRKIDPEQLMPISKINFEEALEMASFGGKVIHDRAVSLAQKYGTRIHICESTSSKKNSGTIICSKYENALGSKKRAIKACLSREEVSLVTVRLPNKHKATEHVIQGLSKSEVKLGSLFQSYSTKECYIEFVVSSDEMLLCKKTLLDLQSAQYIDNFEFNEELCEISVIGEGLEDEMGFLEYFESVFSLRNIEIHTLYTNGIRISVLIEKPTYDVEFQNIYNEFSKVM